MRRRIAEAVASSYAYADEVLEASAEAVGLRREGRPSDIAFCAQESILDAVPRLSETAGAHAVLSRAQSPRPLLSPSTRSHKTKPM